MFVPFMGDSVNITVMFNKTNTYMGFNTDQQIYQKSRDNKLHSYIYKDLNDSIFAATFLDLRNYKSGNLDIYQQFNNIHNQFRDKIQYVTNETIKVSKVHTGNGDFKSSLYMYVFSFANYESEFLYFLAERQHIDTALNKKFVRTCALQLCSNDTYEDLLKSAEYYNGKVARHEPVDDTLKSLFPAKQKVNVRRI
jgi:hypothetical protein